jgi:hypothetical protein
MRQSKTLKKIPGKVGDVTYKGIEKWYKKEFESLGWMVLAKSKGMTDKTQAYVNSVHRLKEAIDVKKSKVYDADRVEDLRIMGLNLDILLKHIHKDF